MSDLLTACRLGCSITTGASNGITKRHDRRSPALEQGQARWSERAFQAQGDLSHPRSSAARRTTARARALFNQAIDSKLRACDLVKLRMRDVCHGQSVVLRTIVLQQNTQRPIQFEITEPRREAVEAWIDHAGLCSEGRLFPSRVRSSTHLSIRQSARIVDTWVRQLGLDEASYGAHTLERTRAILIYRRTKNLRAIQILLGHTKLESTVRNLGTEVNDALDMAEQTEV
jgi:integrase